MKNALWLLAAITLLLAGCNSLQPVDAEAEREALTSLSVLVEEGDVVGQGPGGPIVAANGATLRRTPNGISIQLEMATPEPGTYTYPTMGPAFSGPGHPEAFSLWAFVFDDPDSATPTGVFGVTGHLVGGDTLTLSGHISTRTKPFDGGRLTNPMGAEVHLAVAPHGALDPAKMPAQIQTPAGPGPAVWWIALFDAPE